MSGYFFWTDAEGHLERTEIQEQPVTIGTASPCTLITSDASVGPIHIALEPEPHGCRLRRLSRVRPATVNGTAVEEQRLASGDTIVLGDWEGRFVPSALLASRMLRLTITREEDEFPVELPLAGSITVLGRLEGEILVDDNSVSSRHLELENFGPDLCFIRDLGSTNGTELNGEPLGAFRKPLAPGDVISIGRVRLEVSDGGPTPNSVTHIVQRTVLFLSDRAHA